MWFETEYLFDGRARHGIYSAHLQSGRRGSSAYGIRLFSLFWHSYTPRSKHRSMGIYNITVVHQVEGIRSVSFVQKNTVWISRRHSKVIIHPSSRPPVHHIDPTNVSRGGRWPNMELTPVTARAHGGTSTPSVLVAPVTKPNDASRHPSRLVTHRSHTHTGVCVRRWVAIHTHPATHSLRSARNTRSQRARLLTTGRRRHVNTTGISRLTICPPQFCSSCVCAGAWDIPSLDLHARLNC